MTPPLRTQSILPLFTVPHEVSALRSSSGVLYPLEPEQRRWTLGSQPGCDFMIDDRFVSALHCVIERGVTGALTVRDRGSRNGTFLDGHAIEGAVLTPGSRLSLGRTTLVALGQDRDEPGSAWALLRGNNPSFRRALAAAAKAALTDCSVLVIGETGTGKDLLARGIHERSRRASGPFVAVNCGAMPRELVASELFGHVRGAFTGAATDRDGYFVQADGGTLFLDELGELPLELQPHLLRVLETRKVRQVGGTSERPFDVRVLAATNRLDGLGTDDSPLRLDLFHRVATVVITLPPLRERMDDLRSLVRHFLAETDAGRRKEVSDQAWVALSSYDWPGNARELRHAVARAITLGEDVLEPQDFFPELGWRKLERGRRAQNGEALASYEVPVYDEMARALATHGSIRAAAAAIGMPRSTFSDRALRWGLAARRSTDAPPPGPPPGPPPEPTGDGPPR